MPRQSTLDRPAHGGYPAPPAPPSFFRAVSGMQQLHDATEKCDELAELALLVLERERIATGVDEWDESDPRCLLYCDAWEVLGEDRAYEVIAGA